MSRWRNRKYASPLRPQMYQSISLPSPRRVVASFSASLSTLDEKAPARPRSLVTMRTAARVGFSSSFVSGWSTLENVATADTARVSSRAYGAAA